MMMQAMEGDSIDSWEDAEVEEEEPCMVELIAE